MKHLFTGAKVFVSLGLISWLFYQLDWTQMHASFQSFDLRQLLPLFALSIAGILLSVWKWSYILRLLQQPQDYWHLLKVFWIGLFFNNFLPGRTGGDLYRAYGLSQAGTRAQTTLSVIVDRLLNLLALALLGCYGFLQSATQIQLNLSDMQILAFLTLATMLCLGVGYGIKKTRQGSAIKTSLSLMFKAPKALLFPFCIALVYQTTMILSHVVVFYGIGHTANIAEFFYLIPITAFATLLPISLNGIGLRESAFVVAFAQIGVASEQALTLSLIITLFTMCMSALGGIFYLFHQKEYIVTPIQNTAQ